MKKFIGPVFPVVILALGAGLPRWQRSGAVSTAPSAPIKSIHVLVALCDNENQGIVKVPAAIGNGRDPANNLYWGCGYGVKTFFKNRPEWILLQTVPRPAPDILERVVFKHKARFIYLVADAYDGAAIRKTTADFLDFAAGRGPEILEARPVRIPAGGASNLVCYVGHNGLMDFSLDRYPERADANKREVVILACASKPYFFDPVRKTGAFPLLWTTHLLSAEAYTLHAAIQGWIEGRTPAEVRESAAQAYNAYIKCGIRGARALFASGWD